jgi:hypothetical protein
MIMVDEMFSDNSTAENVGNRKADLVTFVTVFVTLPVFLTTCNWKI